ncbi:fimbria/pilus periplasmic chaperone [Sphingomonas sp. PAMC 26605]|uniref:fimbria/pilus periplasmic chaperone n=1 Tax=Sphingomonas sp. PAMC 26605 TaxID=1112214 RepID=UPI00026CA6D7|nr:fimbria/pilus periplasmic chaperone [Sphingomonas sp. PAMC 26605]
MNRWTRFALATAGITMCLPTADAYSVQPMTYHLTPTGSGSTTRLMVNNTHDTLLNVEVQPFAVTADVAGKRMFTPAPRDFLIFPPQASVAPDKSQLVQIRYVGSPDLQRGKVYVMRVHQTNTVTLTKEDPATSSPTRLNVALHFNTTAIVEPKGIESDLVVSKELAADAAGVLHGQLTNRGRGVADLSRFSWMIDRGGKIEQLPNEKVRYGDAVFIEPGASRDFTFADTIRGPARLVLPKPGTNHGNAMQ